MSGLLLKLKDLFIFRVTLNIFYCSILNNRIGHKFYNLETSSPIPVADLEGGVRPPLKFAKHMLYNVN